MTPTETVPVTNTPTHTETSPPALTATPTETSSPALTATATDTVPIVNTPTPTDTIAGTATRTPTATRTVTATQSMTRIPTGTPTASAMPTPLGICGDGTVNNAARNLEACDDANLVAGDGCENDCTLTIVSESAAAGETVTTDPGANGTSAQIPVISSVTTPNAGSVVIQSATSAADADLQVVGTQLSIVQRDGRLERRL